MGPVFVHLRDVQIPAPVPWGFFFLSKFLQFLDLLPIHSNTMVKRRPDLLESNRPRNSLVRLRRHVAGGGGDQLRFSPSIDMLEHSPMPQKTHLFFRFNPFSIRLFRLMPSWRYLLFRFCLSLSSSGNWGDSVPG